MDVTAERIIRTLYPALLDGARYARFIQARVESLEEKVGAGNLFAAALSDADVSIQNHIELSFLAHFPQVPFFGEEWKSSRNTKYLAGSGFIDGQELLVTLDPVDGTRLYLDQQPLYQVILSVVSRRAIEGAIVLFPHYGDYVYALRGRGAFRGSFADPFESAVAWNKGTPPREVFVPIQSPRLVSTFETVHSTANYTKAVELRSFSGLLRGFLCGGVLLSPQLIDGATLAFIAAEMGFIVKGFDSAPPPPPVAFPDLILPGLIAADSEETWRVLQEVTAAGG